MYGFHFLVWFLCVRGIKDTQVQFKRYRYMHLCKSQCCYRRVYACKAVISYPGQSKINSCNSDLEISKTLYHQDMRCNNCGIQAHFQFTSHILQLVRIREGIVGSFFDQRLVIETVLLSEEEKLVKRNGFYSLAYRVDSEDRRSLYLCQTSRVIFKQ